MRTINIAIIGFVFLAQGVGIAQIPSMINGWPYLSRTQYFAEYTVPAFAYDNGEEHLYYNTFTGEIDKFKVDGTFYPNWPFLSDSIIFGDTPIVVDIDHDGRYEVVTQGAKRDGRYDYSLIYVIDDDGSIMPGFPFRVRHPMTLNVVDIDDDNEYEILCYADHEDLIYCLDRFGNAEPGWPVSFHLPGVEEGNRINGASVADLDLDGNNEYIISGVWGIYAFRFDGSMQPGFPILMDDTTYYFANAIRSPAIADIDLDGYPEIMTSGDNWSLNNPDNYRCFIAVYRHDGTAEAGWPIYFNQNLIRSTVTPADIDGDGVPEIGFSVGFDIYYMHSDGETLPGWPALFGSPDGLILSSSDLVAIDLDGDRNCEIFIDNNFLYHDSLGQDSTWYYGHSWLSGVDHLGQMLPGYPLRTRGEIFGLPPTFSLDQSDNRLYMGMTSEINLERYGLDSLFVTLFKFPDSTGPPDQWPMLNHDNLQTRNYGFVDRVTSINDDRSEILPKSLILKQNYPNPFNMSTMIEFTLPQKEYVTLSIFDYLGRKVVDIYDQEMEAGSYKHRLDMNVPSGVYLYRLRAGKTVITRKMTLLK
jgi:hypothetical protein